MAQRPALILCLIAILAGCGTTGPQRPVPAGTSAHAAGKTTTLPAFDADSAGESFILLGRTHRPLGQVMTLTGVVADGNLWKGDEVGMPVLFVQRIDGVATQEDIRLAIPGTAFDEQDPAHPGRLTRLVSGQTYSIRGFEAGGYEGTPDGATDPAYQTTAFGFHCYFSPAVHGDPTPIPASLLGPADFVDRPALMSGTAANINHVGYLIGPDWRLRSTEDGSPWPDWMAGKPAEVDGVIRAGAPGDFRMEHASRRLIRLADQVGHLVELHGVAHQPYQDWHLRYRGQEILIRHLADSPGWSGHQAWKPVVIRGTLTREPARGPEDTGEVWAINDPSWAPLSALRSPETQEMSPLAP